MIGKVDTAGPSIPRRQAHVAIVVKNADLIRHISEVIERPGGIEKRRAGWSVGPTPEQSPHRIIEESLGSSLNNSLILSGQILGHHRVQGSGIAIARIEWVHIQVAYDDCPPEIASVFASPLIVADLSHLIRSWLREGDDLIAARRMEDELPSGFLAQDLCHTIWRPTTLREQDNIDVLHLHNSGVACRQVTLLDIPIE